MFLGALALIGHMPSEGLVCVTGTERLELSHSRVGLPQISAKHAINFTICPNFLFIFKSFFNFFFFFNFRDDNAHAVSPLKNGGGSQPVAASPRTLSSAPPL